MFIKLNCNLTESLFYGRYEFHIAKKIREAYGLSQELFSITGNVIFENVTEIRKFIQLVNKHRNENEKLLVGEVYGSGLLDEIYHFILREYEASVNKNVFDKAINYLNINLGEENLREVVFDFVELFPPKEIYQGKASVFDYLNSFTETRSNYAITLEEIMLLYFANFNPANKKLKEFFDEQYLSKKEKYLTVIGQLNKFFLTQERFGPDNQDIFSLLMTPIISNPDNLWDQLEFIKNRWGIIIKDFLLNKILTSKDLMKEDAKFEFFGGGAPPTIAPFYKGKIKDADKFVIGKSLYKYALDAEKDTYEPENFTKDLHWMPQVVMIAKNIYVWLDQLSKTYQREIKTLDQIPDEELDLLASRNFNALWLIGIWERSSASKRIKHILGNIDAVASAYSLYDYNIANDLGGESAYQNLNQRAKQRGIRLASDMVPNHTGIYSKWTIEHPEYFIQSSVCPFPNYRFTGENLSQDSNIEIRIEDGYWTRSDAAVVFQRIDKRTNQVTYIYHGNDGTNMPWNDTAQLNMLEGYVREAVIQKIFEVARRFSIIRFDAAMTLAKRHFSRLWYPQPGKGGDIPSRAEHSLTSEEFDLKFPVEFWREVVDRINNELPDTLLLAEAFWLMEGYFVRTLGMHRVYNSAFMHMMMKEENDKYRDLITNTLEFEPEILKRYVNFMSNPDEETAIKQFGTDDKYFGVLTMMITLPGLPMFAHGQVEGYTEKYGMEYQRAYYNEAPKEWLVERHARQIFPIMKKRYLFAEVDNFWIYDCIDNSGNVNENVFAFTNSYSNEKAIVLYNNTYERAEGKIYYSSQKLVNYGNEKRLSKISLIESLNLKDDENIFYVMFDEISKLNFIYNYSDFKNGFEISLNSFEHRVFINIVEVYDSEGIFRNLYHKYFHKGIYDIEKEIKEIKYEPIYQAFNSIFENDELSQLYKCLAIDTKNEDCKSLQKLDNKFYYFMNLMNSFSDRKIDVTKSSKQFADFMNAIKYSNMIINEKEILESSSLRTFYKCIMTSKYSNYKENIILVILYNIISILNKEYKDNPEFINEFNFKKLLHETLLKLGRGEVGVEREYSLLISLNNLAQEMVSAVSVYIMQGKKKNNINGKISELILESLEREELKFFLLVNTYKDVIYFSKERFEEFIDWIFTLIVLESFLILQENKNITVDLKMIVEKFILLNDDFKKISQRSEYKFEVLKTMLADIYKKERTD
jgi:glycosidase